MPAGQQSLNCFSRRSSGPAQVSRLRTHGVFAFATRTDTGAFCLRAQSRVMGWWMASAMWCLAMGTVNKELAFKAAALHALVLVARPV
ncbi:hypothetical protein BCR44DRAFT_1441182 [Catenaria anguillulae PL171]|uniref:Uncharacterized protein n=1 Tax=Catenaria anguillulae PL171 TaxID=765915 RepID=A0A1Y2HG14_9FUNG|nr:hypothetical protein BCR44DRAFT_1441182 [Catenaria anguillulae PL171]